MPHAHALAPLGRRLRSVLATLRPASCLASTASSASRTASSRLLRYGNKAKVRPARAYHASTRHAGAATAAEVVEDVDNMYEAIDWEQKSSPEIKTSKSVRVLKRRKRRDYLSEASKDSRSHGVTPDSQVSKHDISHWNVRSRPGREDMQVNAERHAYDYTPDLAHSKDLKLERITASLIQHTNGLEDTGRPERMGQFRLDTLEFAYLHGKGYTLADIQLWVKVLSAEDGYKAACLLADHIGGRQPVPLFVLQHVLRRPYLNARALRIMIQEARAHLERHLTSSCAAGTSENAVFILFARLLRHAREVWPVVMNILTDTLLLHLPSTYGSRGVTTSTQIANLTYMLNKAMHLIAMPTAVEPFKDVAYQEMAIVRVLRFMTEHRPPLQLNREGYRAVIHIQLAQKKTPVEKQWAELKALSWPPWKQERTAMDAVITAEEHGLTRAGDTLRRMREAGYAPTNWEKVAELFTGWDTDRTPTIQTRALLGPGTARFQSGAATWAARITTTRTAQEAWAAYLAFEEAKLPPCQDVYIAIVQKLYEEEKRQRTITGAHAQSRPTGHPRSMLPGDRREVEPLPPSTHLYTYTRTPVPTVGGFFNHLREHHISPFGHFLAFLVANASTLQLGFLYLRSGRHHHPDIKSLLHLDPSGNLQSIPTPIFAAFVQLLCRHSNVPLTRVAGDRSSITRKLRQTASMLDAQDLNMQHPLVYAMELLKLRRTTYRPPWNAVLRALSNAETLKSMRFLLSKDQRQKQGISLDEEDGQGAMQAYRLVQRVLTMLQEFHIDLDVTGFHCLCLATENVTLACWNTLRQDVRVVEPGQTEGLEHRAAVHEADALLGSGSHATRLKSYLQVLIGDQNRADGTEAHPMSQTALYERERDLALPPLLATPSPAVLHAYIRALGWLGDHSGLLELVNWMTEHRNELAEQRARDRNGGVMMRRALTALRVFLERSWLVGVLESTSDEEGSSGGDGEQVQVQDRWVKNLRRLESAAPADMVQEVERMISGVEDWDGWPSDNEVEKYCSDGRFEQIRKMYCAQ